MMRMLACTLCSVFSIGLAISAVAAQDAAKPQDTKDAVVCDLKTVQAMDYCPTCKAVLTKETLNEKGQCKKCLDKSALVKRDVCIKTSYECCGKKSIKAFDCEKCKAPAKGTVVPSLVIFKCPACNTVADKAGKCTKADCKNTGKDLAKTCEKSGTHPHLSADKVAGSN